MKLPFETHMIYITLDDEKMYQLHSDFSKTEVNKDEVLTIEAFHKKTKRPLFLIHKEQFQLGKSLLMNKENPERISNQTAEIYYKIGFLAKEEFIDYIKK